MRWALLLIICTASVVATEPKTAEDALHQLHAELKLVTDGTGFDSSVWHHIKGIKDSIGNSQQQFGVHASSLLYTYGNIYTKNKPQGMSGRGKPRQEELGGPCCKSPWSAEQKFSNIKAYLAFICSFGWCDDHTNDIDPGTRRGPQWMHPKEDPPTPTDSCKTDSDCDDNNICTVDFCLYNGECWSKPNTEDPDPSCVPECDCDEDCPDMDTCTDAVCRVGKCTTIPVPDCDCKNLGGAMLCDLESSKRCKKDCKDCEGAPVCDRDNGLCVPPGELACALERKQFCQETDECVYSCRHQCASSVLVQGNTCVAGCIQPAQGGPGAASLCGDVCVFDCDADCGAGMMRSSEGKCAYPPPPKCDNPDEFYCTFLKQCLPECHLCPFAPLPGQGTCVKFPEPPTPTPDGVLPHGKFGPEGECWKPYCHATREFVDNCCECGGMRLVEPDTCICVDGADAIDLVLNEEIPHTLAFKAALEDVMEMSDVDPLPRCGYTLLVPQDDFYSMGLATTTDQFKLNWVLTHFLPDTYSLSELVGHTVDNMIQRPRQQSLQFTETTDGVYAHGHYWYTSLKSTHNIAKVMNAWDFAPYQSASRLYVLQQPLWHAWCQPGWERMQNLVVPLNHPVDKGYPVTERFGRIDTRVTCSPVQPCGNKDEMSFHSGYLDGNDFVSNCQPQFGICRDRNWGGYNDGPLTVYTCKNTINIAAYWDFSNDFYDHVGGLDTEESSGSAEIGGGLVRLTTDDTLVTDLPEWTEDNTFVIGWHAEPVFDTVISLNGVDIASFMPSGARQVCITQVVGGWSSSTTAYTVCEGVTRQNTGVSIPGPELRFKGKSSGSRHNLLYRVALWRGYIFTDNPTSQMDEWAAQATTLFRFLDCESDDGLGRTTPLSFVDEKTLPPLGPINPAP
eukprot:TRINITY_DN67768_c10_g1_i4.p1 TRINITY_DN67768_c10_g1~~TRINITY_DN67768_c10_g1_i4.p1  ORF type:complete len:902 (+),score=78.21 TRINITY_DN67768_c10_g1_i4:67-2772(+)